ncbi:MAG: hypothetical protein GEU99_03805 [Luteitalea sp.]|nr:hypothetical protein [Luteitalea sp.]
MSSMMRWGIRAALAIAITLAASAAANAQTAQIVGGVRDETDAVLPGVTLTVTNMDTGVVWEAVSNQQGQYTAPFLPSGRYSVKAVLQGFQAVARENIRVETDQDLRVDFVLEPGTVTEDVLVVGSAPVLNSDTSAVGQVVTGKSITDLPLNGRDFLQLAHLAPGVMQAPGGDRAWDGIVANGTRSVLNSFMLDGVDNNARIVDQQNNSSVVSKPSVDALAEFSIQTNNFLAEHGQAAGAIINATIKSGTNGFRGSLFEFLRNDAFDARDPFALPEDGKKLDRHQFGGTLGGPVRANRTFFFGSVETTKEIRGRNFRVAVPTEAMRDGDFSGFRDIYDPRTTRPSPDGTGVIRDQFPNNQIPLDRMDPFAKQLVDMYPLPNSDGVSDNYRVTNDLDSQRYQIDTRVDQSFSTNSKGYLRYSLTRLTWDDPGPFDPPLIGTNDFQRSHKEQWAHNVALGQTQVLGSQKVNEIRVGYNRVQDDLYPFVTDTTPAAFGFQGVPEQAGITGLPQIAIGDFANVGEAAFLPNFKISEVTQFGDTFSWLAGRHALKLGANYRFIRSYFNISAQARSTFNFGGDFTRDPQAEAITGTGLADFVLGMPTSAQLSTLLDGDLRWHYVAAFVQDDWRVSDRLTLNLGVRYELFTQPSERHGNQANMLITPEGPRMVFANNNVPPSVPPDITTDVPSDISATRLTRMDQNNVGPRVGVAYKLSDATVLRGGVGRFFGDHPAIGAASRMPANPPFQVSRTYSNDVDLARPDFFMLDEGFPTDALEPVFDSTLRSQAWDPNALQAEAYHWNVNVQHQFPWAVVELGYTGSRSDNLPIRWDPNAPFPGPGSQESRRSYPDFGSMSGLSYPGTSHYNAGHVRLERRFNSGVSVIGHYTYSKSIDVGGQPFVTEDNVIRDVRNVEWERGLSSFDVRHNLVVSYIWDIPVGEGRRLDFTSAWLDALLGGWQFNGVTTARSGMPFTPSVSFNEARTGHARPDRIADGNLPSSERSISGMTRAPSRSPSPGRIGGVTPAATS